MAEATYLSRKKSRTDNTMTRLNRISVMPVIIIKVYTGEKQQKKMMSQAFG